MRKLLIADCNEDYRIALTNALQGSYQVLSCRSGTEAWTLLNQERPDIFILDLMLPGIDGYQVCREIRAKSDTPVIMLSAKGEIFDKVLGLELGADDYVTKPFDTKEIVAINVDALEVFENDTVVTIELLKETGIVKNERDGIKILGNGELTKKLTVQANKFSASAVEKIEAMGGKAEVI